MSDNRLRAYFSNSGQPTTVIGNYTIIRDSSRLRAYRNEEFSFVNDLISPETSYNIGLNPKYIVKNHSLLLNSGFNPKPETNSIKVQDVKLNDQMNCQFRNAQGNYILDNDPAVNMGDDTELRFFNNYEKLFSGFLIKFTARIAYQRLLEIRNAYLNQATSANFGFIRVQDPFGIDREGYLMSLTYNPLSEQAEFILREKFTPEGGQFDYDLDFDIN